MFSFQVTLRFAHGLEKAVLQQQGTGIFIFSDLLFFAIQAPAKLCIVEDTGFNCCL